MLPSLRLCSLKIFRNVRAHLDMPLAVISEQCYIRNVSVLFLGYKWIEVSRILMLSLFFKYVRVLSFVVDMRACHLLFQHKEIHHRRSVSRNVCPPIPSGTCIHSILPTGHSNECGEIKRAVSQRMGSTRAT